MSPSLTKADLVLQAKQRKRRIRLGGAGLMVVLAAIHVFLIQRSLRKIEEMDKAFAQLFQTQGEILRLRSQFQGATMAETQKSISSQILGGYEDLGKYLETLLALAKEESVDMEYRLLPLQHPGEAPDKVFLLPIQFDITSHDASMASDLAFTKALLAACPVPANLSGYRSVGDGRRLKRSEVRLEIWIRIPT